MRGFALFSAIVICACLTIGSLHAQILSAERWRLLNMGSDGKDAISLPAGQAAAKCGAFDVIKLEPGDIVVSFGEGRKTPFLSFLADLKQPLGLHLFGVDLDEEYDRDDNPYTLRLDLKTGDTLELKMPGGTPLANHVQYVFATCLLCCTEETSPEPSKVTKPLPCENLPILRNALKLLRPGGEARFIWVPHFVDDYLPDIKWEYHGRIMTADDLTDEELKKARPVDVAKERMERWMKHYDGMLGKAIGQFVADTQVDKYVLFQRECEAKMLNEGDEVSTKRMVYFFYFSKNK